MSYINILVALAKSAGAKLPLIWPSLLIIASELSKIAAVLGVTVNKDVFRASQGGEEFAALCAAAGVDPTECQQVLDAANAADDVIAA